MPKSDGNRPPKRQNSDVDSPSSGHAPRKKTVNNPKSSNKEKVSQYGTSSSSSNTSNQASTKVKTLAETTKESTVSNQNDKVKPSAVVPNIEVKNNYGILTGMEDEVIMTAPKPEKKTKVPPMIVKDRNVGFLQSLLKDTIKSAKFSLNMMKTGIRVDFSDMADYDLAKARLSNDGIEFFAYHTPATKLKKIVLKGLPRVEISDLKSSLNEHNVNPDEIKLLPQRNANVGYDEQATFILYFKPGSVTLTDLQKIRYLDHLKVTWEHFQSRRHDILPQCRRCQLFGHSSVNCGMKPRCMVCADNHPTAECPKRIDRQDLKQRPAEQIDRSFIKCSNCLAAGLAHDHTASWKGCPKRKEYSDVQHRLNSRRRPNDPKPGVRFNSSDFPAFAASSNGKQRGQPTGTRTNFVHQPGPTLQQEQPPLYSDQVRNGDLFTPNELCSIWQELLFGLRGCKSKVEQINVMGSIIIKYAFPTTSR